MARTLEAGPSMRALNKKTEISEADAARELVRMAKVQGPSLPRQMRVRTGMA